MSIHELSFQNRTKKINNPTSSLPKNVDIILFTTDIGSGSGIDTGSDTGTVTGVGIDTDSGSCIFFVRFLLETEIHTIKT